MSHMIKKRTRRACDFIRRKIAQIVKDPEKARKLTPRDYYVRWPWCDRGYFDRENVDIVT
jgi:cyclohexanone monooxygenase